MSRPWPLSSRTITAARTATCRAQHRTLVAVHVFTDAYAVAHGAGTYVVLGAGLDTFALRYPFPALQVVEFDFACELSATLDTISGPTFVSCLGNTYYRHRRALDATFAIVASLADRGRTEVVLDYAQHDDELDAASRRYLGIVRARVDEDGESSVSAFSARQLEALVEAHGFSVREHRPHADLYERLTGARPPSPAGFGALAHPRRG